ncbi:MAG: iron export transporter permease subunit FetB [Actinoallomurus sp.]|jgi:putative ABC transport system permease protein|nr:iron export transporter permease subunit FetB [Actinoallomurus sp.]
MSAVHVPSWPGVAASLVLVAVALAVVARARLRITRELVVAVVRAGVQLVAVGAVLLAIFKYAGLPGAFGWAALMVVIAGQVAGRRGGGVARSRMAATIGVAAGGGSTLLALVLLGVIAAQARVVVPVAGMIIGGSMQASGLALRRVDDALHAGRPAIEARLFLGLSAREAFAPHTRDALHTALLPVVDSTKVVGLITLPGAMTGLILGGVDPLTAIRYQIVVMYMMLAAAALSAYVTTRVAETALFDEAHRLRE